MWDGFKSLKQGLQGLQDFTREVIAPTLSDEENEDDMLEKEFEESHAGINDSIKFPIFSTENTTVPFVDQSNVDSKVEYENENDNVEFDENIESEVESTPLFINAQVEEQMIPMSVPSEILEDNLPPVIEESNPEETTEEFNQQETSTSENSNIISKEIEEKKEENEENEENSNGEQIEEVFIQQEVPPFDRKSFENEIRKSLQEEIRASLGPEIRSSVLPEVRKSVERELRPSIEQEIRTKYNELLTRERKTNSSQVKQLQSHLSSIHHILSQVISPSSNPDPTKRTGDVVRELLHLRNLTASCQNGHDQIMKTHRNLVGTFRNQNGSSSSPPSTEETYGMIDKALWFLQNTFRISRKMLLLQENQPLTVIRENQNLLDSLDISFPAECSYRGYDVKYMSSLQKALVLHSKIILEKNDVRSQVSQLEERIRQLNSEIEDEREKRSEAESLYHQKSTMMMDYSKEKEDWEDKKRDWAIQWEDISSKYEEKMRKNLVLEAKLKSIRSRDEQTRLQTLEIESEINILRRDNKEKEMTIEKLEELLEEGNDESERGKLKLRAEVMKEKEKNKQLHEGIETTKKEVTELRKWKEEHNTMKSEFLEMSKRNEFLLLQNSNYRRLIEDFVSKLNDDRLIDRRIVFKLLVSYLQQYSVHNIEEEVALFQMLTSQLGLSKEEKLEFQESLEKVKNRFKWFNSIKTAPPLPFQDLSRSPSAKGGERGENRKGKSTLSQLWVSFLLENS